MKFKHKHKIALILTPREKKYLKAQIMYIFQSMKAEGNAKKNTHTTHRKEHKLSK